MPKRKSGLKPFRIEVDCVYVCESCGCETWYTIRELEHRKYLDCVCGKRTSLMRVKHVDVVYDDHKEQFRNTGKQGSAVNTEEFVVALVSLGYKKKDARQLVEQNIDSYNGDETEFLRKLVSK